MAVRELRQQLVAARQRLSEAGEADYLLAWVLARPTSWLFAHPEFELSAAEAAAFEETLQRREAGEPVAYITGRRGFWTLELEVGPTVLIPRPETELLVEAALARIEPDAPLRVADLGTGSGAIALALATERPAAEIWAVDVSASVLQWARRNAQRLGLARVHFAEGDWLAPLQGRFQLIVANPPYIEADDPHLACGDLRFEPLSALAAGRDGLTAIRRIVADARDYLAPAGWLLLEHGWQQGAAVGALLRAAGYQAVACLPDLEGRDRVSMGRWPGR